jgi:hypothetical protein
MIRFISIITLLLIFANCKTSGQKKKKDKCVPYFQYDNILHYSLSREADTVWTFYEKNLQVVRERKYMELLTTDLTNKISDTIKFEDLLSFGFTVQNVPEDKFNQINELFCERRHKGSVTMNLCIPTYRDILLFKKNNRTIGYAKLCFDCDMSNIVGTTKNTELFGQAGVFEKLKKLLIFSHFQR